MNPSLVPLSSSRKRKRGDNSDMPKRDVFLNYSFQDAGNSFVSRFKGALAGTGWVYKFLTRSNTDPQSQKKNSSSSNWNGDTNSVDGVPRSLSTKYDVFLNYSSQDIGNSFISHLKRDLDRASFVIFDHTMVPPGQDLSSEVSKAIQESEIYVPVFSTGYANSSVSCLDELVEIMNCHRRFDARKVLPVFFDVEPCDVRKQVRSFESHETTVDQAKFQKWKQALKEVGQLSGQCLQNYRDEAEFVSKIVEELEKMQSPRELHVADHPVGIRSRVEELMLKLRLDSDDVLVVVVHGFSGIGKTTVVKATYNRIAANFDGHCFIADIHSRFGSRNWKLVKELISHLTRRNPSTNSHIDDGVTKIRRLMSRRKILLVLDDVDNFQQLEALIGTDLQWLYKGSRIIVTARDKQSLAGYIPFTSYQTRLLNRRESFNLFTRILFSRDDSINTDFIKQVVGHAGGIPLVIKVWSCHFRKHNREQWPSILETLKRIPHRDVQKQLQISYDSLDERQKRLFLDIVFFFIGWDKDLVVKVLEDEESGFYPDIEIQYLVDKSLVEISGPNNMLLGMHDAIREMGEEIVRRENVDYPGRRTRLSNAFRGDYRMDVEGILTECSGTESVESIAMWMPYTNSKTTNYVLLVEALRKMRNLRLIQLNGLVLEFSQDDKTSPCLCFKRLRYMDWDNFPFKSLDNFHIPNLVVLHLRDSKLEILWEGLKSLKKLRILDVRRSYSLSKTGDFYGLENLEELSFAGCSGLQELDGSICLLQKLAILDISFCDLLIKRIPNCKTIGKLPSLRKLNIMDSKLEDNDFLSLHESLLQLHQLNEIVFDFCENMRWLPNLPQNITSIQLTECRSLVNLPSNMSELKSLTTLCLAECPKLGTEDPYFLMKVTGLTNLRDLSVSDCSVLQVPTDIGNLVSLKRLDLSRNPFFSLPDSLSNLLQLDYLDIGVCDRLGLLPLLPPNLNRVDASGCSSLHVMPFDMRYMFPTYKGSPFRKQLLINYNSDGPKLRDWCSCRLEEGGGGGGGVLSFVTPMHLGKRICGMILCTELDDYFSPLTLEMLNKTKNTSQRLKLTAFPFRSLFIIFDPLDHTTLTVEPGDTVLLQLSKERSVYVRCALRLIYENDVVVDPKLVLQNHVRDESDDDFDSDSNDVQD